MGLTSIFSSNANLTSIFNPAKQVLVKDITHKVTMEVNEKGSRAGAVTGIYILRLYLCSFIVVSIIYYINMYW